MTGMNTLNINPGMKKSEVFDLLREDLVKLEIEISNEDQSRPWGGFFVLEEGHISAFKNLFFPEVELDEEQLKQKLSPKILVVAPEQRLSWQYHHRRAEIWKLVNGQTQIVRSQTDHQNQPEMMQLNKVISLAKGERHRLVGSNEWGVVAEIWMHTDPSNPSDEEDIVRVSDDYARN